MNWVDVANNQCFSRNTLINAVANGFFFQKNTIPTGTKQITKAEAEYYVDINTISGKSSNQLVVKSNLVFPGYFYQMDRYNCTTCTPDDVFPIAYSSVPLTFNYFYAGTSPYTYRRLSQVASTSYTLNFSTTTGTASCVSCATLTEFAISDTNYGSDTGACGATPPYVSAWSTGSTSPPVFGDVIYANSGGTVLLNSGYYLVPDSFPAPAWIRLDGSSQVIENGLCP